ncbi:MAG: hypothetical protein ACOCWI_02765 [Bacillota bacterium]
MANPLTFGQIMEIGSLTTILGIIITFLIFALLLISLAGIQKAIKMNHLVNEKPALNKNELKDDLEENEVINTASIVAAITAAVAVVLDKEKKPINKAKANFVVKSIKRI